jgi:hypothetical protein
MGMPGVEDAVWDDGDTENCSPVVVLVAGLLQFVVQNLNTVQKFRLLQRLT